MTVSTHPGPPPSGLPSPGTMAGPTPTARRSGGAGTSAGRLTYAVLSATALVFVLPFYYMIVAASRPMSEMAQAPPPITPGPLLLSNIGKALAQQDLGLALANSFIVSGVITVSTVLLCTLAGFAFAKLRFRGRSQLFALAVGTMMIPPSLGVVPLYSLMVSFDLAGSLASVILPSLVAAFGVFFMRQYLVQTLPDELLDAAKVDGATTLRTYLERGAARRPARHGRAGDADLHDRLE